MAELGVRRFDSPRQLTSYLGLVPSERSTGQTVRRGGITTGNSRARRVLVEGAWTYRHAIGALNATALVAAVSNGAALTPRVSN